MTTIHFRDATPADACALVALINGAYRPPSQSPGWTAETGIIEGSRTDERTVATEIGGDGRYLVGSEVLGGPIVTCVSVTPMRDSALYLSAIAVDPARQDHGIGRSLLGEVERQGRAGGIEVLRMSVIDARRELIAWYERRGFVRTGEVLDFPYGDDSVGRPLRQDLSLVVLEKRLD